MKGDDKMANTSGSTNGVAGIYKCSNCGHERTIPEGHQFPPCSDCNKSGITWILVRKTKN